MVSFLLELAFNLHSTVSSASQRVAIASQRVAIASQRVAIASQSMRPDRRGTAYRIQGTG